MRKLFLGLLIGGLFMPSGFAEPRLEIHPPAKKITADQTAVLTVRLEWPRSEGPYEINSRQPKLENLKLEKQNQSQETGATVSHSFFYEFRPTQKGPAVIYPFEISYRKSETDPWIPLMVPEQNFTIISSSLLRAIFVWFLILAGSSALIVMAFRMGLVAAKRKAAQSLPPPDPKQKVYARAEESIATFASPDPKEKIDHWVNALRTVVTTYYDMSDERATLAEISSQLQAKGLPVGEWNEIARLFEQLSEMQFSRQDIPARDLEETQKTLLQYVRGKIIIGNSNS